VIEPAPISKRSEFARNWPILVGAALGMMIGVTGIVPYSLGILLPHFTADFGWQRAQIGLGQSLQSYGAALAAPLAGWMVDRMGLRRPAAIGLFSFAALLVLLSFNRGSISALWITMTLMGFSAALCGPLVFTRAVNLHFHASRGLALGLVLGCVGIGAFAYPVVLSQIVEAHGWRMALKGLGLWVAIAALVVLWLLVPAARSPDRSATVVRTAAATARWSAVLRNAMFWRLAVAFALAAAALSGYLLHIAPLLRGAGLSALEAATIQGLMGPSIAASRLLSATLADYISAPRLTAFCMLLAAAGAAALGIAGAKFAFLAVPLLGFGFGCEVDMMSYMIARYFPLPMYGRTYGIVYAAALIGAGTGPVWLGAVFDRHGSYTQGLWISVLALLVAAIMFITAPRQPSAVRD
jgi:predicted MFS family arabinose efflux permease